MLGEDSCLSGEGCTACGTIGKHTGDVCVSRRPRCHVHGCERPTCIQAVYHKHPPTCLVCFFEREKIKVYQRERDDARAAAKAANERADTWREDLHNVWEEMAYYDRVDPVEADEDDSQPLRLPEPDDMHGACDSFGGSDYFG